MRIVSRCLLKNKYFSYHAYTFQDKTYHYLHKIIKISGFIHFINKKQNDIILQTYNINFIALDVNSFQNIPSIMGNFVNLAEILTYYALW